MEYRVLLAESDRSMLERLCQVVDDTPNFTLAAKFQNVSDALGQGAVFNPNLILLDIEQPGGMGLVDAFKKVYPAASILCMGDKWQAESASGSIKAGAKGYIIKPFSGVELQESVDAFSRLGSDGSAEILVFFSPKGKSGKTTLIANLAMSLARKSGEPVGIIDADLQFGDMAVFFNLAAQTTIVEAVRDIRFLSPASLSSYYMPVAPNVSVLCGTRTPNMIDKVAIDKLENLIAMSRGLFRYILIDVPAGFNPTSIAAAEASNTTFLVSMINGAYEIDHMKRALHIFRDWEDMENRAKVIFTRVEPCDAQARLELSQKLGYPVTEIIPNDYAIVSDAADKGKMATDIRPDSPLSRQVDRLADNIIGRKHRIRWAGV
ncbi:pilus assembly protein CpaE [Selenomonas ruminantium]|uniref:Pilus assembly protein CpaE n=1 Tax=Selenomonas ruminantium TaxID=971 RepID=A0A1M6U0X2_SELRU|nr:response regulator [Selenomonas ruminantium]SHK62800.1 pilus assembly protein CpaE [Selenomonas ruminantium]